AMGVSTCRKAMQPGSTTILIGTQSLSSINKEKTGIRASLIFPLSLPSQAAKRIFRKVLIKERISKKFGISLLKL
ncbi:MAG: hypothetical protein M3Z24_11320, partial [Chloroflexota bacterium]|nr:hypothetical protein [Chloroflexota bacterium]